MNNTQAQPDYKIEVGPLAKTYGLFVPSTINTGAQISADRVDHEKADELRSMAFYTANVALAVKRGKKLLLGIGGNEAFNAVFGTNTDDVCKTLVDTGYISLNPRKKELILMLEKAGDVVFVEPKYMALKGNDAEYRSFPIPIRTGSYEKDVTIARMPWVSAGYGSGYMLGKVMYNLGTKGKISETIVFTINPEHVAENVKDDEIVARACWLSDFGSLSIFNASVRNVDDNDALRGVRSVGEADAHEVMSPLETLVAKGSVAHGSIAVVRKEDVSSAAWQLLTQKQ